VRDGLSNRDELVVRSLGLVRWVLRRLRAEVYVAPQLEEDIRSAGVVGLVQAAARYRPGAGSWLAYARERIRGAMLDALTAWNATVYWSRAGRVLIRPELLPLAAAMSVAGRDEEAEADARLTAAEILGAAPPAERAALETFMYGDGRAAGEGRHAVAAARWRLGIIVHDVHSLGRTFPVARFWSHVPDRPARGCWIWQGTLTRQGYGQFSVPEGGRRWRHYLAHRVAWLLERGELPRGARVVQTCGNRRCVRPDHMRLDTRRLAAAAVVLAALLLAG